MWVVDFDLLWIGMMGVVSLFLVEKVELDVMTDQSSDPTRWHYRTGQKNAQSPECKWCRDCLQDYVEDTMGEVVEYS